MGVWDVVAEGEREQWDYSPSVNVGPLRFGMTPTDTSAVLGGFTGTVGDRNPYARYRKGEFRRVVDPPYATAVSLYFGEVDGLFCVVFDAQFGPQVNFAGLKLVGRAPSRWEADLIDHLESQGISPQYAPGGDPGADEIGLIMNVQRAANVVLTRPALLIKPEWANTLWDALPPSEGRIYNA